METTSTKKMSSKKKKRFEKYMQKKIKKEERVVLFEKLSKSSFSSELMKSSRNLGRGKNTMKERLRRAFHERRRGMTQSDPDVPLFVNSEDSVDDVLNNHMNTDISTSNLSVPVKRSQEIQPARIELPVCEEEQAIMETINQNFVKTFNVP
ncbi:12254_t:CDS:2, partial [Cetraspora pellucida]